MEVKFSTYLNRHVFVMSTSRNGQRNDHITVNKFGSLKTGDDNATITRQREQLTGALTWFYERPIRFQAFILIW